MGQNLQKLRNKRFKINPVEWVLFGVMGVVFSISAYQLVYQDSVITRPLSVSHYQALNTGRSPASAPHPLLNLELPCQNAPEEMTQANKVRISGQVCGSADEESPSKTSVVNSSNRFTATVFMDNSTHKFSTDYIPLNSGKNLIHVEFALPSGKTDSRDVLITKN